MGRFRSPLFQEREKESGVGHNGAGVFAGAALCAQSVDAVKMKTACVLFIAASLAAQMHSAVCMAHVRCCLFIAARRTAQMQITQLAVCMARDCYELQPYT
jgi:hypothetical protein